MASTDLVIGYHKLDTEFFAGHVQHTTFRSDASRGRRQVRVVKKWYRDQELGRGSFGTVFLERSERGEYRAVKEIAKDRNSKIRIDYRRELMAMATLAKHDALFVQLFGWYESDYYVYIAMEYIGHGHLRNYLEVERSESEAKVITRQLLEGLVVIHQEGFAHRDLKPENIFVVSESPVWVKIGDFGLAKLARDGTALRTQAFTSGYFAPEAGIATSGDSSEYTNAVDIWAVGCIAHEVLTRVLPFQNFFELSSYCTRPEFPRNYMLLKNISREGMEIVESMLALHPERRIAAKEALDSEWLRPDDDGQEGWETEDSAGSTSPEVPGPSGAEVANGDPPLGSSREGIRNHVAITVGIKDQRTTEDMLLELGHRLQVGFLSKDPLDEEMSEMAKHFGMLESLGHIDGETVRVGEQAAIDSVRLADVAALMQTTKIAEVLRAIIELPSVPRDEEYQFRKRSTDLLQKWNEPFGQSQAPTSASPAAKKEEGDQNECRSTHTNVKDPVGNPWMTAIRPQAKSLFVYEPSAYPRTSVDGQAEKGSASRSANILMSPKPHPNIDPDAKRVPDRALEAPGSTDSPHRPSPYTPPPLTNTPPPTSVPPILMWTAGRYAPEAPGSTDSPHRPSPYTPPPLTNTPPPTSVPPILMWTAGRYAPEAPGSTDSPHRPSPYTPPPLTNTPPPTSAPPLLMWTARRYTSEAPGSTDSPHRPSPYTPPPLTNTPPPISAPPLLMWTARRYTSEAPGRTDSPHRPPTYIPPPPTNLTPPPKNIPPLLMWTSGSRNRRR